MIYDVGDAVRYRSGQPRSVDETLVFIVRSVNLSARYVITECINPVGIPSRLFETMSFNQIELLEV